MTPTATKGWQEILSEPFDPSIVKWRPGKVSGDRALAFAYVDARNVMDRLDEAFGPSGWHTKYMIISDEAVEATIGVWFAATADGPGPGWVEKSNVGYCNDPGRGENSKESEKLKAAYSDAFKRASVDWGIGRELYDTPQFWLPIDDSKRFSVVPVWVENKGWTIPENTSAEPINAIVKRKVQNALQGAGFDVEKAKAAVKTATGKESLNLLTMADADKLLTALGTPGFVAGIKAFTEEAA